MCQDGPKPGTDNLAEPMNMSTVSSVETTQFKGFAPGFDGANAESLADELGARFVTAREAISNFVFGQKTVVDQVLIGFCNLRDDAAIRGIHIGKFALASHEFAIDVVENRLHEVTCFADTGDDSRGIVTGDNYPSNVTRDSSASFPEISL